MIDKFANIAEIATAYRKGEISPIEIVESCLSRIEKLEPKLEEFEIVFSDRALNAAKAAENAIKSGHRIGLFHGIPLRLHDLRRTMVTIMNDKLGVLPRVVEAVVNHITGSAKISVAGVYSKVQYLTDRRDALNRWNKYLEAITS